MYRRADDDSSLLQYPASTPSPLPTYSDFRPHAPASRLYPIPNPAIWSDPRFDPASTPRAHATPSPFPPSPLLSYNTPRSYTPRSHTYTYGPISPPAPRHHNPPYLPSPSGLPINAAHGIVLTESRGIFIGNLPYKANVRELREMLATVGRVERCEVPMVGGRAKGYATALFAREEEARRAVEMLDGREWGGRGLRVRLDRCGTKRG